MSDKGENDKDGEVLPMVHDLLKNSSSHGLPNIYASASLIGRLFWFSVFLAGLCLMSWQVYELFVAYFSYDYTVSVEVRFNRSLPFPAVTVCNLNPVMRSRLHTADNSFRDKFDTDYVSPTKNSNTDGEQGEPAQQAPKGESSGFTPTTQTSTYATTRNSGKKAVGSASTLSQGTSDEPIHSTSSPAIHQSYPVNSTDNHTISVKSWDEIENEAYFSSQSEEFKLKNKLMIELSTMPLNQKQEMGHDLRDMLLDCTWRGYPCSPANFTTFYHFLYGNCYTFNNGKLFPIVTSSKPGPHYGLSLELFIDQEEYMDGMTESAGFRVSIHNPQTMPFPEDDGLSIGPGQRTSIATRVMELDRLGKPWGDCQGANLSDTKDIFIDNFEVGYSKQTCERSCYQYAVMNECKCADSHFPFPVDMPHPRPCNTEDNDEDLNCVKEMETKYDENRLRCDCNQTCHDTIYIPSVSQSKWPSQSYVTTLHSRMSERNAGVQDKVQGSDGNSWTESNVAKLDVYFMEFNYQYIKQSPATTIMDLLSNIGGQLGLWIGVSVVTLMEMMQLVGAVMGALIAKFHRPNRTEPSNTDKNLSPT